MKKVDIKSIVIPNRSRSGNYPTGSTVTPSGGGSNSTIINQGGGVDLTQARKEFLSKKTSDEAKGIINFLKGIKIAGRNISNLLQKNSEEKITDEAIMSAARVILEIGNAIGKLDNKFLRKDQSDSTNFLLQLLGGAEFGKYASGISGGKIDEQGAAELLSLLLRSALTIGEYKKGLKGAKIDEEGVADLLSILVRSGIESANFSTGALGAGFCLKKDENGDSYLEVDRMLVRKVATFIQLLIQQIKHVGGQIILTPASMSCVKVEDKGDYYRCYFENTDGEKTIEQEFEVGDLARAQTFNVKEGVNDNVTNTYYWRAVVGTGDNYIDLSKTDCDAGSTEPKAGDDIVQLGNKSDATRQAAIILSAYGNDAPYFKLYRGINSYSLDGKEFVSFSRSEVMIIADTIRFSSGETIEEYINNVTGGLVVDVESAKKAAEEAQKAAAQASEDASKAVERLDKWSADGVISPTEKQSLKDEIARIDADKTQIANGYAKYNLGTPTNYNNAHTAYRAVLVTLTASTPETISIPSDFSAKQTAYYTQRTNALTAISNAARDYAQGIANDLNTYKQTVSSQFEQTNNSITAAVTSSKEYTDNAISGIQVGGRNLIVGSDNGYLSNLNVVSPNNDVSYSNVDGWRRISFTEQLNSKEITHAKYVSINKEHVTFSIICRCNGTFTCVVTFFDDTYGHAAVDANVVKIAENTYKIYATYNNTQKEKVRVVDVSRFTTQNATYVEFRYPKLEYGTKPTDWSPAPEDSENALTEYKKEVTAQFSVLEGEISSKVSSTEMTTIKQEILNSAAEDATNKINDIQVGGRNLCLDSNKENEPLQGISPTSRYKILNVDTSIKQGEILESERYYTLSIWYKPYNDSDPNKPFTSFPIGQAPGGDGWSLRFWKRDGTVINEGEYYKWTGTIKAKVGTKLRANPNVGFILEDSSQKTGMSLYKYKLEEGNKPTAWSPAPEDSDAKYATITTVESMQTEITQLSSEISLRAYKTEVTAVQNNLNQTNSNLSSLTTRVSEAEIALQPDNIWIGISSKVTTTSKINNIVPDSCFDDANYNLLYTGGSRVSAATANNNCPTNYCMKSSQRDVQGKNYVAVTEGEKYYISGYVNAALANYNVRIELSLKKANGSTKWIVGASVPAKTQGWQKISGYVTIPAEYVKACIWFTIDGSSNFGSAYFTKVYAYKVDSNRNNLALNSKGPWTANKYQLITYLTFVEPLKSGTIYTVSWKGSGTGRLAVYFSNGAASATRQGVTNGIPITANNNYQGITFYSEHFKLDPELETDNGIDLTVSEVKVEEGERATDWCYSEGDYSTTEEIKAGMQITDKGFNFFGQEFNFSGRISVGDLDPTIIEDGYLRASLINADTLVAKTLNAVNTDGVSTLVNKDGLKMTQGSNELFKLTSQKNTVGTTRYYAQLDLTTRYSDGSTLQGTLTPESLFLRGKTTSSALTLETKLMYNGLSIYDENKTGLTITTKGIRLTYCTYQNGYYTCRIASFAKCIYSAYISSSGYVYSSIGANIPKSENEVITFSVSKTATGTYKVMHNIGDTSYKVQITPIRGNYFPIMCVKERTSTYFTYACAHYVNGGFTDADCAAFVNVYYESPELSTF